METISTNISCIVSEHPVVVLSIIAPSLAQSDLKDLTAVCENGNTYPLAKLCDEKGKPLTEYATEDPWYFFEWFRTLQKEQRCKSKNPFHTEYCFTEMGQEYWYENTNFNQHFTCCEG